MERDGAGTRLGLGRAWARAHDTLCTWVWPAPTIQLTASCSADETGKTVSMESVLKDMEARLEKERKAREREEQKHVPGEKGQKTSTLHRDSDFTLESPDGRVSPLPMAARPLTTRSAGETTRKSKTDATVCYSPSRGNESAARLTGNGVSRSVERGRQRELLLGEFERRLLNAKRLGKAPMPSVEDIP